MEIIPSITPTLCSGSAMLEAFYEGDYCPIKIWLYPTKGTELTLQPGMEGTGYVSWNLWQETLPEKLYVEGCLAGGVVLVFSYNNVAWCDIVGFHVVEPILFAYDIDGVVLDANEENVGAYVHFNLDNDNSSNNSVGAPKHPGGDYLETSGSVSGENDLKLFGMFLYPWSLSTGIVLLDVPPGAKVWKSAEKGSANLVFSPGEYAWDLSNPDRAVHFKIIVQPLYMLKDVCIRWEIWNFNT